jgi:hypothetical protein
MTKTTLLAVLADIRAHVERDDSFEGFLNYLMPGPDDPEDAEFMVEARYRIGNLDGQGNMRMIGKMEMASPVLAPEDATDQPTHWPCPHAEFGGTHHLVPNINGVMQCQHCGRTDKELRAQAAQQIETEGP